jgi:hypothetical protein
LNLIIAVAGDDVDDDGGGFGNIVGGAGDAAIAGGSWRGDQYFQHALRFYRVLAASTTSTTTQY